VFLFRDDREVEPRPTEDRADRTGRLAVQRGYTAGSDGTSSWMPIVNRGAAARGRVPRKRRHHARGEALSRQPYGRRPPAAEPRAHRGLCASAARRPRRGNRGSRRAGSWSGRARRPAGDPGSHRAALRRERRYSRTCSMPHPARPGRQVGHGLADGLGRRDHHDDSPGLLGVTVSSTMDTAAVAGGEPVQSASVAPRPARRIERVHVYRAGSRRPGSARCRG